MGKKSYKKKELVFDEKKRQEFLTGFSKRKQQRKKKAADEFQKKIKEEQKRIQDEAKDFKNKLKQSFQPIEELKDIIEGEENEEFETEDAMVSISTINTASDLRHRNFIGVRPLNYEESEDGDSNDSDIEENHKKIPGMESDEEKTSDKKSKPLDKEILKIKENIKSEKDLKRFVKKKAKQELKKSKVIQSRNHLHKKKSIKLSHRKKHFQEKFMKKHKKIPKHNKK